MNDVTQSAGEDVSDVLIAISVVARRLAKAVTDKKEGGVADEQDERAGCSD